MRGTLGEELLQVMLNHLLALQAREMQVRQPGRMAESLHLQQARGYVLLAEASLRRMSHKGQTAPTPKSW